LAAVETPRGAARTAEWHWHGGGGGGGWTVSVLRRVELTTQVGYRVGWGQEGQIARSNGGRWPMGMLCSLLLHGSPTMALRAGTENDLAKL
jgi:hypothetical protein